MRGLLNIVREEIELRDAETRQLRQQMSMLRDALHELRNATLGYRTVRAIGASAHAFAVWRDTLPDDVKARALRIAQEREPTIQTFSEAIKTYGTSLLND